MFEVRQRWERKRRTAARNNRRHLPDPGALMLAVQSRALMVALRMLDPLGRATAPPEQPVVR